MAKRVAATCDLPSDGEQAALLTFDDGPHPEGTPAVLDVLRRHNARAVFFVVGSRVARAPALLTRILEEGHVLGNHSFAHPLDRSMGFAEYRADLRRCQRLIEDLTGTVPKLFRPPLGQLSAAGWLASRLLGLQPVLWSIDSDDWRFRATADVDDAATRLSQQISGRPIHDILLFHDERVYTAELLDRLLPAMTARHINLRPGIPGYPDVPLPAR
jgi:peptidoglycan/xylan/chitin deacetylase (PgdA/CDA1 family)